MNAGTRLYLNQTVAVTVNGGLAINNAAWVQGKHYNGAENGFVVNAGGTIAVTEHARSLRVATGNGTAYLTVNNGGSLTASGCTFSLHVGVVVTGSTISLTNDTFGGMLYCPATYVSQLENNTSFGVVDISGGTLSQDVALNVLGNGMTQYQLDSS